MEMKIMKRYPDRKLTGDEVRDLVLKYEATEDDFALVRKTIRLASKFTLFPERMLLVTAVVIFDKKHLHVFYKGGETTLSWSGDMPDPRFGVGRAIASDKNTHDLIKEKVGCKHYIFVPAFGLYYKISPIYTKHGIFFYDKLGYQVTIFHELGHILYKGLAKNPTKFNDEVFAVLIVLEASALIGGNDYQSDYVESLKRRAAYATKIEPTEHDKAVVKAYELLNQHPKDWRKILLRS